MVHCSQSQGHDRYPRNLFADSKRSEVNVNAYVPDVAIDTASKDARFRFTACIACEVTLPPLPITNAGHGSVARESER